VDAPELHLKEKQERNGWIPDLSVIGMGRVGLVTALSFAAKGHRVLGVDLDHRMVAKLRKGQASFFEPGLHELLTKVLDSGNLEVSEVYDERLLPALIHLVCVDTGSVDGSAIDLTNLLSALRDLSPYVRPDAVVALRSTAPPGTTEAARRLLSKNGTGPSVACNPEFLREGSAVEDFFNPDRVVLGVTTEKAREALMALYSDFPGTKIVCHARTAEMVKYAANALLAVNISFVNEIAGICERVGADVRIVSRALRLDHRFGPHAYLEAGLGFGGSCLPKDIAALALVAKLVQQPARLLAAAREVNDAQRQGVIDRLLERLGDLEGRVIGIIGLAFKPDTDDVRAAPGLEIAQRLVRMGAWVRVYDPLVEHETFRHPPHEVAKDIYEAADGAEALVMANSWDGLKSVQLERIRSLMRRPLVIDGRNVFDPQAMRDKGFEHIALGVGDERQPVPYGSLDKTPAEPRELALQRSSSDGLKLRDKDGLAA
jgi:UDPglucose 6-dehydrogenase